MRNRRIRNSIPPIVERKQTAVLKPVKSAPNFSVGTKRNGKRNETNPTTTISTNPATRPLLWGERKIVLKHGIKIATPMKNVSKVLHEGWNVNPEVVGRSVSREAISTENARERQ